ncbi:unnamed protein product, partial [Notodromas monacha]
MWWCWARMGAIKWCPQLHLGTCVLLFMDVLVETIKGQLARFADLVSCAWASRGRTRSTWHLDHYRGTDIPEAVAGFYVSAVQLQNEIAEVTSEMETLEPAEDTKNNLRAKQLSIGRKKFNMDPKKGIEWLINEELIESSPLAT